MEPKRGVAKLTIANSRETSNREIREESEIAGNLHRNYKKWETYRSALQSHTQ
jgi:hypothetical protein